MRLIPLIKGLLTSVGPAKQGPRRGELGTVLLFVFGYKLQNGRSQDSNLCLRAW